MLARLQRLLVLTMMLGAVAWAAAFWAAGRHGWASIGVLLMASVGAIFLGVEFMLAYAVQRRAAPPRASVHALLRAWFGEVSAASEIFLWRQPFRSRSVLDETENGHAQAHGVVLVHGYVCNRGLWNHWMRRFRALQTPFIAVNLEPVFGSIDDYPHIIEAAVSRLESKTRRTVVLVGHSMGGLAIRAWLERYRADSRVRRIITVATPHRGTWLARYAHTRNGKEMRIGCQWLKALAAHETPDRLSLFTCYYGPCDNIVFPVACGTLEGAVNRMIETRAHMDMLSVPDVFAEVAQWIDVEHRPAAQRPDDTGQIA